MMIFRFLLILLLTAPAAMASQYSELSFADSLAAEGDHYRAITEYKRFLHYNPDSPRAAFAELQIAHSLIAGERWIEVDLALEKVWKDYPDSPEAHRARELYADVAYRRGDYKGAADRYAQLQDMINSDRDNRSLRQGLTELQLNRPDKAKKYFKSLRDPQLQRISEQFELLPNKSPHLAASLSAVLPGAGQLYTERPRQAALAFALNAAFIYAAVESWENDNHAVSAILSLFEIGWYGGNIYNAMNNAHKYNQRQQQNFIERLQNRFDLSLGWRDSHPELTAQIRF